MTKDNSRWNQLSIRHKVLSLAACNPSLRWTGTNVCLLSTLPACNATFLHLVLLGALNGSYGSFFHFKTHFVPFAVEVKLTSYERCQLVMADVS